MDNFGLYWTSLDILGHNLTFVDFCGHSWTFFVDKIGQCLEMSTGRGSGQALRLSIEA